MIEWRYKICKIEDESFDFLLPNEVLYNLAKFGEMMNSDLLKTILEMYEEYNNLNFALLLKY